MTTTEDDRNEDQK